MGEGEVVGPAKVAGGREGSWADQTWYGTVEGPAMEGPAYSGTFVYSLPTMSRP